MKDCPMNGPKVPENCPTCGRARGDGCAIAETGPWPDTSPREDKPVSDPARSALAAFVSACGGNPPDWLREEHAAAENALATPPADAGALLAEALAYEAEAFEEQEEVDGGDLVEWFAEWRERAKSAAPAPSPDLADVLARAEYFIEGFSDDETQEGIPELLRDLKAAREKAEG